MSATGMIAARIPGETSLECSVARLIATIDTLRAELADVKAGVEETREIVKAWEAVKAGGKFVKWIGAVAAALSAIAVAIKGSIALVIK